MSLFSSINIKSLSTEFFIFLFSFIILFNLGFHILIYFPLKASPDMQNYLAMAHLDFDQSPIRKYRIIIPLLAFLINSVFGWSFNLFHPWTFDGDFSMCMSFLMVNTAIMSWVILMIFKLCSSFQIGFWYSLLAIVAVISGRWTAELSGLPLVDSLYLLSLVMALFGLKTKRWEYVIASIWIGPWAKEAFIFMAPVILIFAKTTRTKMFIHLLFSGIVVFGFRYLFDIYSNHEWLHSFKEDVDTFSSIPVSLQRIFSVHGVYDVFSIIGFWIVLPLLAYLKYKPAFIGMTADTTMLFVVYLCIVLFQAMLSTDIPRMLYLSIPVISVWIAISFQLLGEELKIVSS